MSESSDNFMRYSGRGVPKDSMYFAQSNGTISSESCNWLGCQNNAYNFCEYCTRRMCEQHRIKGDYDEDS